MAADTLALSLVDLATTHQDPLVTEVALSMIDAGAWFQDIPVYYDKTFIQNGLRVTDSLPSPDWVPLNTDPTTVKSNPSPYQEQLYIFRNKVEVDHLAMEEKNQIEDPMDLRVRLALKGATYDLNDKLINNNHTTGDADCFVGIRERLSSEAAWGCNAACRIDAGAVDMRLANMTAATFNTFMSYIDRLLDEMDSSDGEGVTIIVNDTLGQRMDFGARQFANSGGFGNDKDKIGRTVKMYKGAKIRRCGRKAPTKSGAAVSQAQVITSTETSAGADGASTHTSLYAIKPGKNQFYGWSFAPTAPKKANLKDGGVMYETLIEGSMGLKQPNTRAVGRIFGINLG